MGTNWPLLPVTRCKQADSTTRHRHQPHQQHADQATLSTSEASSTKPVWPFISLFRLLFVPQGGCLGRLFVACVVLFFGP
jgi:hypothetical protein